MRLRPLVNPDSPPSGDMLLALNWFETKCRIAGVSEVTEEDVVRFLVEDEGRIDLGKAFVTRYLCALPDDAR